MAWEIKGHTADIAIECRGPSKEAVIADSGTALASIATGRKDPRGFLPAEEMAVSVEAPDDEALVVAFLSELLWRLESDDLLWLTGGVNLEPGTDGTHLTARGNAARYDPKQHGRGTEIKAITYHGLRLERDGQEWVLEVLIDI